MIHSAVSSSVSLKRILYAETLVVISAVLRLEELMQMDTLATKVRYYQ